MSRKATKTYDADNLKELRELYEGDEEAVSAHWVEHHPTTRAAYKKLMTAMNAITGWRCGEQYGVPREYAGLYSDFEDALHGLEEANRFATKQYLQRYSAEGRTTR